ncbi:ABC transporter permease subunit [Halorubrum sp. JWXQ-INN 858]|uniref:ABC transporter permease n=1 Tax=Halorubrum sp. JWXQ-INN 858 TaxID=2690782 RepID=UPI0013FB7D22|nr:ABC transporter permease [Halorubrum sp. JWXQ-INN 858]MWV64877.1 ABC transporter permease subunit [Halorubrum sp. JWXQ-INN 858]
MLSDRVRRSLKREFSRSLMAKIGLFLVVLMVTMATFAPFLAPHDPTQQGLDESNLPPAGVTQTSEEFRMVDGERTTVTVEREGSLEHPLGTDALGRDLFSRVLFGARTSLMVGLFGTLFAVGTGVSVGLTAGYYGGRTDDVLMRFADIMLAFPALVLAIALVGLLGPLTILIPDPFVQLGLVTGMPANFVFPITLTIVVGVVNWVWFARIARGEALSIRQQEYVKAARSLGASDWTILRQHILPNSLTPIIVLATIQVAAIILLESSLSFLGFSGTSLSWGFDIAQGRQYLGTSWWIASMPGLAIVAAVVGINLLGDWLRDALDPGLEGEHGGGM